MESQYGLIMQMKEEYTVENTKEKNIKYMGLFYTIFKRLN